MQQLDKSNPININWSEIREQFYLDSSLTHLSALWLSKHPKPVQNAIDYYRSELSKNTVFYLLDNEKELDSLARESIAKYIKVESDNIILTRSSTEGLGLFLTGWNLSSNDEILTTIHEHYSAFTSINLLSARTGALINRIKLYDVKEKITEEEILTSFKNGINPNTKLIVITWVHSCSGVRIPIEKLCNAVHAINDSRSNDNKISICIDGTHGFGAIDINVGKLQCDLFISSCHKWLNGPRGTGFTYISNNAAQHITEIIPSFSGIALDDFMGKNSNRQKKLYERLTPGGFLAYEHKWAIKDAIQFVTTIGPLAIEKRILSLARYFKDELNLIDSIKVLTPLEDNLSAGIICFEISGMSPELIVKQLRLQNIVASVSPYRIRYARFTPSYFNNEYDIENALNAVKNIIK